jgi:excisionase family DNA binding protein
MGEGYSERMGEDHYDPQRVAHILSLPPERVYEMLESGELEGVWEGRMWRIPKKVVHERLPDPPKYKHGHALQDPRIEEEIEEGMPPIPPTET